MDLRAVQHTADHNGYYLLGDGPLPVLVLHGWLSDATSWCPLWPLLNGKAFTWCFMDARGYGLSRGRIGAWTMTEFAQDALHIADELHWDWLCLVGHSMGGLAIQHAPLFAPDRVEALVGVTPVPASGGALDTGRFQLFRRAVEDPAARSAIIERTTGGRHAAEWTQRLVGRSLACSERDAVRGYLESWAHTDISIDVGGSPVPVGVIVGEHDPSLTPERMRSTWLRWYPNSTLEVLPNAGHYPMDETPTALVRAIERLLALCARVNVKEDNRGVLPPVG